MTGRAIAVALILLTSSQLSSTASAQFNVWTYSPYSPTGNAYVVNQYGAFPVYSPDAIGYGGYIRQHRYYPHRHYGHRRYSRSYLMGW